MTMFIKLDEFNQPVDHPIAEENMVLLGYDVSGDAPPEGFAFFERVLKPDDTDDSTFYLSGYDWDADVVKDIWVSRPYTEEELGLRWSPERAQKNNKELATKLLLDTDYTQLPDVSGRIANMADILAYRDAVRTIAINPPIIVETWPDKPDVIWE